MTTTPSRRAVLSSSAAVAASAVLAGAAPRQLRAQDAGQAGKAFRFVVVNDTHSRDAADAAWFDTVVKHINALAQDLGGVEACLLAGDVAHDGTPAQLAIARDALARLSMPVYTVPGNHDFESMESRAPYDAAFPDATNYHFDVHGWQFVALDSTEGTKYENTTIAPETIAFLDSDLPKLDKTRPTVLFTHFPMAQGAKMVPTNAADVMARFADHSLRAVYNGHWHGITETVHRGISVVTNKCCSEWNRNFDNTPEKGYWLCSAEGGRVLRTFIQIENAPTGLPDGRLPG